MTESSKNAAQPERSERRGRILITIRANYNNQSDKFGQWKEIKEFLARIGIAR